MLQFLTIVGYIIGVIAGGISIYEFGQKKGMSGKAFAGIAIAVLIVSLVFTFLNGTSAKTITPTSTVNATVQETISPTATSPIAISPTVIPPTATALPSPTTAATVSSLPTQATPTLAPAETLFKNIKLSCNCSDRVVATITKIVIQPDQGNMLWSMTFFNNSQRSAYAAFADGNFYLQEGNQTYDATGSVIGTFAGISLQAGETQQVIITFSFVPFKDAPYKLVSIMQMDCCGQEIAKFNPVPLSF